MILHYWFLFPVGIAIAIVAMSAGVSGAAFWIPVYLLWLGLDVAPAFWLGLFTMLFGFGSGAWRNWRDRTYNGALVRRYSVASVPAAVAGALAMPFVSQWLLIEAFGIFVILYGLWTVGRALVSTGDGVRAVSTAWARAIAEGFLTGLISIGTGLLTLPVILPDGLVRTPAEAVGSSVMIIYVTTLAATLARLNPELVSALAHDWRRLAAILMWATPAVVIGGQLGPRVARRMPSYRHAALYLGLVLMMVGALTLMRPMGPHPR